MSDEKFTPTETHVGLENADAFEIATGGGSVTGKHLYADGGDGQEKEVNVLDPVAGASSPAPASSGIPSAMTQQGIAEGVGTRREAVGEQTATPIAERAIPVQQNLKP